MVHAVIFSNSERLHKGMVDGKCEVGNYERDCGWVLIYKRLKELGRLDLYTKLRDSVDWSESGHQREVVWR